MFAHMFIKGMVVKLLDLYHRKEGCWHMMQPCNDNPVKVSQKCLG